MVKLTVNEIIFAKEHHLLDSELNRTQKLLDEGVCYYYKNKRKGSGAFCAEEGLLLPFWEPTGNVSRVFIASIYTLAFMYIFIGVSLLSGRVMMAVEVITSQIKVVSMIRDRKGKMRPVTRKVWSEVVANLTLFVIGFSSPEILITLVEIVKHDFRKADLGPETIVGSRAYHLFIITAICIVSVPQNQAKRVRHLRVYMLTSFWAIFAYLWIYLIISVSTQEVIDIWEAIMTLLFYPVVVFTAWMFERFNIVKEGKKYRLSRSRTSLTRHGARRRIRRGVSRSAMTSSGGERSHSPGDTTTGHEDLKLKPVEHGKPVRKTQLTRNCKTTLELPVTHRDQHGFQRSDSTPSPSPLNADHLNRRNSAALSTDEDDCSIYSDDAELCHMAEAEYELRKTRELLGLRLKALKDRFPDRSQLELETIAEISYLQEMPKNQSYYRILTTRQFTGEGDLITLDKIRSKLLVGIAGPELKEAKPVEKKRRRLGVGEQRVFFCPAHYVVVECEPFVELKLMREGDTHHKIEVYFETADGTASAGDDYIATSGKVVFDHLETQKTISVPIIDDEEYEDDEYFSVRLISADFVTNDDGKDVPPEGAGGRLSLKKSGKAKKVNKTNNKIELGPHKMALVTILDDDHCGVFSFPGASIVVPDNLHQAEIKVIRSLGAHGRIEVPFELAPVNAVVDKDFREPEQCVVTFDHREFEKNIKIAVIDRQRAGDDSIFMLKLLQPKLIDEPVPKRTDGLPRIGEMSTIKVVITESDEMKETLDRLQTVGDFGNLFRTTWRSQFIEAVTLHPTAFVKQDDGTMIGATRRAKWYEYVLHIITLPWKLAFAALPPTGILNGWVAFFSCIAVVVVISVLIEDLAAHFGCVCGIEKPITAITVVAIGTSLPDMFASRAAAVHEKTADAALAHISGSNAVNVYLGLGIAWTIASIHHRITKGPNVDYKPTCFPHHLATNVLLFSVFSIAGLGVLIFRRYSPLSGRAELGGPLPARIVTAGILVLLYVTYITLTILVTENIIVINV